MFLTLNLGVTFYLPDFNQTVFHYLLNWNNWNTPKKRNDEKSVVKYVQNVLIITNQFKYSLTDGSQHV